MAVSYVQSDLQCVSAADVSDPDAVEAAEASAKANSAAEYILDGRLCLQNIPLSIFGGMCGHEICHRRGHDVISADILSTDCILAQTSPLNFKIATSTMRHVTFLSGPSLMSEEGAKSVSICRVV